MIQRLGISKKLHLITLIVAIGFVLLSLWHLQTLSDRLHEDIRVKTAQLVDSAHSVLVFYEEQVRLGKMTTPQAQQLAISMIKHMRYNGKEYFWIHDMSTFMVMHPYKPELDGTDISSYADPNGKHLFVEMVDVVKAHGAGFVSYMWPKPGELAPVPKISYVKGFAPWGWIIGSGVYVDEIDHIVSVALREDLLWGSCIVLVVLMAIWFVGHTISVSTKSVMFVMNQLATGNYDVHVTGLGRKDELGRMAEAIDIFRKKSLMLKDAQEQLNLAKSEFLSNMSHELRTPMHAIMNYATMGIKRLEGDDADARLVKYLANIREAGDRLLRVINDLLDLSKMEAGKMSYEFAEHDLLQVIAYVESEMDGLLKEKELHVKVECDLPSVIIVFDKCRITQVLVNIIANAIRYSSSGGEITVSVVWEQTQGFVKCSIADQGTGVPEGELELVFDKFAQSSRTNTNAGGTGLGLSICKQIIAAHHGAIWAEHGKPTGAVFAFTFPVAG